MPGPVNDSSVAFQVTGKVLSASADNRGSEPGASASRSCQETFKGEIMRKHHSDTRSLVRFTYRFAVLTTVSIVLLSLQSCGGVSGNSLPLSGLMPAMSTVSTGSLVTLSTFGTKSAGPCSWSTSNPAVLLNLGQGRFRGANPGTASALAACGTSPTISALVQVTAAAPSPLVITAGGVYSGTWTSSDPDVPAVKVQTDQPVTLRNAIISGRGDLIRIENVGHGGNVTVRNVTGTALDPGVPGRQRGAFLTAENVSVLRVAHCSMYGVSYGLRVLSSTPSFLRLTKNLARELEDRASDGRGGLRNDRPSLGHFIFLNGVNAPNGADISWNEVVNTIGSSSTEDVINIFKSQGSPAAAIRVHDNYMEGYSSTTTPSYTGAGIISDGDRHPPVTAFVSFEDNDMVHTAGSGVQIAVGHDILARNNRVVSCGTDAGGKWFAMPYVNAVVFWNYYGAPEFSNNIITGTQGGVLRPDAKGVPMVADLYTRTPDLDASDRDTDNLFSDPCLAEGKINLQAEEEERTYWRTKLAAAGVVPGDRHQP